ncbi:MAG: hypothetical protein ACI8S6_000983 [Myxococcota bacterium]|jgi:hypothetical protein
MMPLSLLIALGCTPAAEHEPVLDDITIRMPPPESSVIPRAERITVEVQYETSITVSLEGPHWDLTDFVHGRSPWLPAETSESGLQVPEPTQISDMPQVSSAQIQDAIRDQLGEHADGVELPVCAGPNTDACSVGLSAVYLRVTAWEDDTAIEQRIVKVRVPMGC